MSFLNDDDFLDGYDDIFHTSDDDFHFCTDGPQESDTHSDSSSSEPASEDLSDELDGEEMRETGKDASGGDTLSKVLKVLHVMSVVGIDLASFFDALSWGDEDCIKNPTVRSARTKLMMSDTLPRILRRWWNPPSPRGGVHARGARASMESFVVDSFTSITDCELEALAPVFTSPAGDDISEQELTSLDFSEVTTEARRIAPTLSSLLDHLSYTPKQRRQNMHQNSEKIELTILSMLSYARSHRRNRLQKMFAVYFKFRGITAKAFDTLHALALTMSHKWTCNAVGRMSKQAMEEVKHLMEFFTWLLSYDNLTLPFKVFSQRIDNQSEFGSGAAATVYVKRDTKKLSPTAYQDLQEQRAEGMKNPITGLFIFDLSHKAETRIRPHMLHHILQILLDDPKFDFATYKFNNSSLFNAPSAVDELPIGLDHVTLQFLLGSVNIPEAGYEDNSRLIKEWLRQLGLDTPENIEKLSLEQLIAWIGDQLTIDRLRKLFKFRAEDLNGYDRLDWMILVFGWLHLMMAFANTLHKQYFGTSRGRGLSQAFDLLKKKGLATSSIQGPFYHDLDEVLHHMAAAHLREDWCLVAGIEHIHELRDKTPTELLELAEIILDEHASNEALSTLSAKPEEEQDEVKQQTIMWSRDILHYIVLDQAIRNGDVGLMEDFLPHLLFRFVGGGSSNYTIEVLELLQGLHREWPDEIKYFVRHSCWLVNFRGKRTSHLAIDKAQEHNIKRTKVNYHSEGPSVNWDYMHKLHPAIPVIDAVADHIEDEFKTLVRGKKHTVPKAELDIQTLHDSYRDSRIHKYIPGRKQFLDGDRAVDFISKGAMELANGKRLQQWIENRSFHRVVTQEFDLSDSSESDQSSSAEI